jgi:hypothetical protein
MDDVKDMMETHVFGTIRVMKGALLILRSQNSMLLFDSLGLREQSYILFVNSRLKASQGHTKPN